MRFLFLIIFMLFSCNKSVINPHVGSIIEAVYGLGTVESENIYQAKAAVVSTVTEFYVKEGQDIHKGQKLFRTSEGVTAVTPFDGRVTEIRVAVLENIFPQTTILTVINLEKLYLSVSLEQQAAMRIKKGTKAEISFEFFRNKKITGVIDTIYPKQNEFIAKVNFSKIPEGILPGMTADVAFEIDRKSDAVLVPAKSIVNGNIFIKRNGEKKKFQAKIGLMDLEFAEILEPKLELNDEIVIP